MLKADVIIGFPAYGWSDRSCPRWRGQWFRAPPILGVIPRLSVDSTPWPTR
jgi:hypothetical protein